MPRGIETRDPELPDCEFSLLPKGRTAMTETAQASPSTTIPAQQFLLSTTFDIPGFDVVEYKGACFGLVVRSVGYTNRVTGAISGLQKGEVSQYTSVLEEARRHAIDRLIANGRVLGGNAILGMRFDSSELGKAGNLAEIIAYGVAVHVQPK